MVVSHEKRNGGLLVIGKHRLLDPTVSNDATKEVFAPLKLCRSKIYEQTETPEALVVRVQDMSADS